MNNKKTTVRSWCAAAVGALVLICLCASSGCGGHTHSAAAASCDKPSVCEECGEVLADPLGHVPTPATCTTGSVCEVCGEILSDPLGHDVSAATCETPSVCLRCGEVFAPPLGHDAPAATCETPSVCSRCGEILSEPLGHDASAASCTKGSVCLRCGEILSPPLGHDASAATCETPSVCLRCGEVFAPPLGHDASAASCTKGSVCLRCGEILSPPLGHSWEDVTVSSVSCVENGLVRHSCSRCGESYDEVIYASGHVYGDGNVCSVCGGWRRYVKAPMIYQGEDYPNGCESVSAVMALRHLGISISVDEFIDKYLPMAPAPEDVTGTSEAVEVDSPWKYYIGDPRDDENGYYCFATVIYSAANKILAPSGRSCALRMGESLESLFGCLDRGVPVVIWTTLGMSADVRMSESKWLMKDTGHVESYICNLHCVLLVGADDKFCYVNDPLVGPLTVERDKLAASYTAMGAQALTME